MDIPLYDLAGDMETKTETLQVPNSEVFDYKKGRSWRLSVGSIDNCSDNFAKQGPDGKVRGMSVVESTLSLISCIIGAGIVSIPYALTASGIYNGICLNIGVICVLMFASHLYIKSMEYLKLSSISELCYMSMGKTSIYIVNAFFVFIFFGVLIMYNVLFSNVAVSVFHKSGLIALSGLQKDNLLVVILG